MILTLENRLQVVMNELLSLVDENEDISNEPEIKLIDHAFQLLKLSKTLLVRKQG